MRTLFLFALFTLLLCSNAGWSNTCSDLFQSFKRAIENEKASYSEQKGEQVKIWQEVQYEAIMLMHRIENCVEAPKSDENQIPDCQGTGWHTLAHFTANNARVMMAINEKHYQRIGRIRQEKRRERLWEEVCTPQKKQMAALCRLIKPEEIRRKEMGKGPPGLINEYTFGSWFKGEHPHHQGPPGAVTTIMGAAQTLFSYMGRSMAITQARNRDTYYTNLAIFNHRFYHSNCIGRQSIQNFQWNFTDSSGQPLSTDGQPILPNLSNWDILGSGNFTDCNPETFISPFALTL